MNKNVNEHFKEFEFTKLVRTPKIVESLVYKFFEKDPKRIRDTQHLKIALPFCDRRLFMNFREYKITYDQLLSRVEKIRFGEDYPILDDMIGTTLDEKFLEEPKDPQLY